MQNERTLLVQKLTLIVLVAILGCLVVLIAQNRASKPGEQVAANELSDSPDGVEQPVAGSTDAARPKRMVWPFPNRTNAASAPTGNVSAAGSRSIDAVTDNGAPVAESIPVQSARSKRGGAVGKLDGTLLAGQGAILKGKVLLLDVPPPETPIAFGMSGANCGALNPAGATTRHYIVSSNGGLANVVVYVKSGLENYTFPVPPERVVIENFTCFFEPYVSAGQVGQTIRFRNLDDLMHNIHCTAKSNREFNFAQPMRGAVNECTFNTPEVFMRIKCDVHEWEFAYLSVLPHPFFAVSDQDGNYKLPRGLPPGTYNVAAYHLKAGELTQNFKIGLNTVIISNSFTFQLPPRLSRL